MSWSHFTTLLVEGDLFTAEQRNELYDAFIERADAVAPWLSVVYSASSYLRDSGFATDLIERDSGGPQRLLNAISDISHYFIRPDVIDGALTVPDTESPSFYGTTSDSTNLLNQAATAAGISVDELDDLLANPFLDAWRRWNVWREAIRLLKYPLIKPVGAPDPWFVSVNGVDWSDALSEFFAYPEVAGYGAGATSWLYVRSFYSAGPYDIDATRGTQTLNIPATTPFSAGYALYGFLSRNADDNVGGDVTVLFDGSYVSAGGFPFDTDRKALPIGAGSATGNQDLDASMAAYYNSGAMSAYESDPISNPDLVGSANLTAYVAAPTFTHD